MTTGTSDPEIINGTGGADQINGFGGADTINGGNGFDTLNGGGGDDSLGGGSGGDSLYGGNGHDELNGGFGNDTLSGGNGADALNGGAGDDVLYGGNGDDLFTIDGAFAGNGVDTIMDFDVGRSLRRMTFDDSIELLNVGGKHVSFVQTLTDVELYFDGELVAVFQGSEGVLDAHDLFAVTVASGDAPLDITVVDLVI